MNITIVGSGNVGTVLYSMLKKAGHIVRQLAGRGPVQDIGNSSDLYILAIADDILPSFAGSLQLNDKLVVHTAGSVSIEILQNTSTNYGVFYPLQSIRKELNSTPEIPILIGANTEENKAILYSLAATISKDVHYANDEQRRKLHLAAVITNNFINHLLALTEDYCQKESIDFKLLLPLINETIHRLQFSPAKDVQTGPAQRNDITTIQKQREMLIQHPSLLHIYQLFTESIISLRSS